MRDLLTWIAGAVLVVAVVYAFSQYANKRQERFETLIGSPAADFEGDFAINGVPASLTAFKGKVVLLDFWAVWCKPCINTFPHLRQWDRDFKKDGLEIVGVTMYNMADSQKSEEQAQLKEFARKHQLAHLLMALPDASYRRTCNAYHVEFYPTVFLIDRQGVVRFARVGGDEASADAIESEIKKLLAEKT